jgi:hypothetical protein
MFTLDINNDTIPDIISACRFGLISMYFGNGDGTFQKEKCISPGMYMSFFLPGDYNKDGNIDFVTNGKILLGNGKGDFSIHRFDMGTGDFTYGASGDIDGDGYPDLVVGDHLNILINNGDGSFIFKNSLFPNQSVQILNISDYNGDGFPDLFISHVYGEVRSVDYLPSTGKEAWGEGVTIFSNSSHESFFSPEMIDINKDGKYDFFLNIGWQGATLFLSDGRGNFLHSWDIESTIVEKSGVNNVYAVDIDNDSNHDFLILTDCVGAEPRKGCLSYYPGKGDGIFGNLTPIDPNLPRPSLSYTLATGDFNRDGLADIAIGTLDSHETPGMSVFISSRATKVEENWEKEEISSLQYSPNPFNSTLSITYSIQKENTINIEIYDVLGRKVKTLIKKHQMPGKYTLHWKGDDCLGGAVSSGLYFCIVRNGSGKVLKGNKIMLMK